MNQRYYRNLGLSLFLFCVGVLLWTGFQLTFGIESKSVAIPINAKQNLITRIYTPKTTPKPQPVMILCHGVNASKESMTPLAIELARHGIAAIAFDFGGYGESYSLGMQNKSINSLETSTVADAKAILDFVRSRSVSEDVSHSSQFDSKRIGIAGHSMGGTTALKLAQLESQLQATVVLSISGFATPTIPNNLFLGVGLYEQLNPPSELRQMWQTVCPDGICNNFQNGTARQLVISETTDHFTAPYDPKLIRQVIRWTQQAFDLPLQEKPLIVPWFIVGGIGTVSGSIVGGVWLVLRWQNSKPLSLQERGLERGLSSRPKVRIRYSVTGVWGIILLIGWIAGTSNLFVLCSLLQLVSNYGLRHPGKINQAVRISGLYVGLGLAAFCLSGLLRGAVELWHHPLSWLKLPQFLLQWIIFIFYNYGIAMKVAVLDAYTFKLQPSWFFLLIIGCELIQPGIILTGVEKVGVWLIQWLRRPLTVTGLGKVSGKEAGLIGILVVLLIVLLDQRRGDIGQVASQGIAALEVFGLLLVLPIGVGIGIVRSRWFQRLEHRLT
ncbi:MAG: alpha/beta fold hydrolase [Coleofasciculus sp. A1-SPW-01]|uniref:alpha/beta hydrolase n=1 Tax=Coleofasciculus sp. A1-SPW-01 TaxID=3070819 RepID=UPI0032F806AA